MKKILFSVLFSLLGYFVYADGSEQVCVLTNTGSTGDACSASQLGFVDPCTSLTFIVKYLTPPTGFVIVAKYEWFVNGISVKINTTTPSDFGLDWVIKSKTTTVLCKVTYKKQDGTLSQVFTSTSFTPNVKQLNFADNGITATTALPNFGCTTNTVSFSLNTFTCTGNFCSGVYNVGQYSITWQAPSGWTQTSISTNGDNVSFLPDASTGGTLTATITLPCGYTDTRTFTVNRVAEKPTFSSSSSNTVCSSPANVAINSTCGAIDYTYTIVGSTGITFAANGLQTLTTSSTSPILSLSGNASIFIMKAKANYPGNNISDEASKELIYGTPQPGAIQVNLIDLQLGRIEVEVDDAISGGPYNWYRDGVLVNYYHANWAKIPIPRGVCDVDYGISVENVNACGTSAQRFIVVYVPCEEYYRMSPNPASSEVTVSADEAKSVKGSNSTFDEICIYDKQGNLKKYQKHAKVKQARVNVSGLSNGTYFIEITNGTYKERKPLIIQK